MRISAVREDAVGIGYGDGAADMYRKEVSSRGLGVAEEQP